MQPSAEEKAKQQREQDSLNAIRQQEQIDRLNKQKAIAAVQDSIDALSAQEQTASAQTQEIFITDSVPENEFITIENDVLKIVLSTRGGRIYSVELKEYVTFDSLPLILFDSDSSAFGLQFFMQNKMVFTNDLFFEPLFNGERYTDDKVLVETTDPLVFSMRYNPDKSSPSSQRYIEYVYTINPGNYMIEFDINLVGMQDQIGTKGNIIDLFWSANLRLQEKAIDRFNGSTIYYKLYKGDVDYLSETSDDEDSFTDKLKWASFKQHFFSSTLIASEYFVNPVMKTFTYPTPVNPRYLKTMELTLGLPFGKDANQHYDLEFYFGPNKYNVMRAYKLDLEKQIPLGWSFFLMQWINRYAVIPVFNFLGTFGWNYGIIILVLTLLLKLVLFPIAYKMYKSTAKMRVLKPEIDELGKKFPKKEDSMKKQQATMDLYRKAGVNPMAGCVPMLLQFPILIAMFRFFPSSIELRQQSFLWATDLSTYDSIFTLPFNIPFYGDHVSLFTLLMTVSTILYTRVNNQMMGATSTQMPGMKTMMYLMPVMFLGIFNNYAAALSYYYLLANLITFGQMFIIRKTINEKKILDKIQERRKQPKKKSGFQKRLEDAAKKRGYNPNQKKK